MRHLAIFEEATKEAICSFVEKRNLSECTAKDWHPPQEDYLAVSDVFPIFVVSDGVTLNAGRLAERGVAYPNSSPAGDVARIFCNAVCKSAGARYGSLDEKSIIEVFREANSEVAGYNQQAGKSDTCGNMTGFYAATGAFVVVKDGKAYWAAICDAFVAHFDEKMQIKFMSSGTCTPYAVINGEEDMVEHLQSGVFDIESGDRVFVFSDGFEHYAKNPDFLELFTQWDENVERRVALFTETMSARDPEKYGHERSLIAISV